MLIAEPWFDGHWSWGFQAGAAKLIQSSSVAQGLVRPFRSGGSGQFCRRPSEGEMIDLPEVICQMGINEINSVLTSCPLQSALGRSLQKRDPR